MRVGGGTCGGRVHLVLRLCPRRGQQQRRQERRDEGRQTTSGGGAECWGWREAEQCSECTPTPLLSAHTASPLLQSPTLLLITSLAVLWCGMTSSPPPGPFHLPSPTSPTSTNSLTSPAVLSLLERACLEYDATQSKAAEAFILSFQTSSRPYPHCHYILAHSTNHRAVYTALTTLKDALLREWALLPLSDRHRSRDYVFSSLDLSHSRAEAYVVSQALHVLVLLLKRQWVEDRERAWDAVQSQLHHLMLHCTAPSFPTSPSLPLRLVQLLFTEFSVWHTTPLRVSMEAHLQCHVSFERQALLRLFSIAVELLQRTTAAAGSQGSATAAGLDDVAQAVKAVEGGLSWEFNVQFTQTLQALSTSTVDAAPVVSSVIEPSAAWRTVLTQSQLTDLLLRAHQVAQRVGGRVAEGVMASVMRCWLQLASLKGPVLEDGVVAHVQELVRVVERVDGGEADGRRVDRRSDRRPLSPVGRLRPPGDGRRLVRRVAPLSARADRVGPAEPGVRLLLVHVGCEHGDGRGAGSAAGHVGHADGGEGVDGVGRLGSGAVQCRPFRCPPSRSSDDRRRG